MKRNVLILAGMAVTMLAIISCQKELESIEEQENNQQEAAQEEVQPSGEAVFWIKASVEDTKTEMDGLNVHWVEGDQIVVNGETSLPLTSSDIHTDGTADFGFTTQPSGNVYKAIYPASAYIPYSQHGDDDVENAGQYYVELPKTQAYTQGKFDPEAAIMLAKGSDVEGLVFSHVMTYLRLTFNQPVKSVRVMANNGIRVRGYMKTVFQDGNNQLGLVTYNNRNYWNYNTVTMDCGGTVAAGDQIVIAIPPKSFSTGLNFFVVMPGSPEHYSIIRTGALDLSAKAGVVIDQSFSITKLDKEYFGPGIYCETDWNSFICADESKFTTDVLQQEGSADWLDPNDGEINIYKDFTVSGNLLRHGSNNASYPVAANSIYFTETLDGNGHTLTQNASTVPLVAFLGKADEAGIIKNLTLAGSCSGAGNWQNPAFAIRIFRGGVLDHCINKINTVYTETEAKHSSLYFAGLATSNGGTIQDCQNQGNMDITLLCDANRVFDLGGIATSNRYDGMTGDFIRCVNSGNITVIKNASGDAVQCLQECGIGGICATVVMGESGTDYSGVYSRFENCSNSGTIKFYEEKSGTASGNQLAVGIGGIVGISTKYASSCPSIGSNDTGYYFVLDQCTNTGTIDVSSANNIQPLANNMSGARETYIGGLVGFAMGSNGTATVNDNTNYVRIGGSNNATIKLGSIGGSEAAGGILGGGGFVVFTGISNSETIYEVSDNPGRTATKVGGVSPLVGWIVKRSQAVAAGGATLKMDASALGSLTVYGEGIGVTGGTSMNAAGAVNGKNVAPLLIFENGDKSGFNFAIMHSSGNYEASASLGSGYQAASTTFYGKATTSGTYLRSAGNLKFVAWQ